MFVLYEEKVLGVFRGGEFAFSWLDRLEKWGAFPCRAIEGSVLGCNTKPLESLIKARNSLNGGDHIL